MSLPKPNANILAKTFRISIEKKKDKYDFKKITKDSQN